MISPIKTNLAVPRTVNPGYPSASPLRKRAVMAEHARPVRNCRASTGNVSPAAMRWAQAKAYLALASKEIRHAKLATGIGGLTSAHVLNESLFGSEREWNHLVSTHETKCDGFPKFTPMSTAFMGFAQLLILKGHSLQVIDYMVNQLVGIASLVNLEKESPVSIEQRQCMRLKRYLQNLIRYANAYAVRAADLLAQKDPKLSGCRQVIEENSVEVARRLLQAKGMKEMLQDRDEMADPEFEAHLKSILTDLDYFIERKATLSFFVPETPDDSLSVELDLSDFLHRVEQKPTEPKQPATEA